MGNALLGFHSVQQRSHWCGIPSLSLPPGWWQTSCTPVTPRTDSCVGYNVQTAPQSSSGHLQQKSVVAPHHSAYEYNRLIAMFSSLCTHSRSWFLEFLGDGPVRALLGTRSNGVAGGSDAVGKKGLGVDGPRWNIATCKTEEGCKMGFNLSLERRWWWWRC